MVTRDRVELAEHAVACFAGQTWPSRELVIIDDGCVDYGPMLEPYLPRARIRYLRIAHTQGQTLGALRNLSIDESSGTWCLQWDDDEWYHPDRIAVQFAALGTNLASALRWTLMEVNSPRHGQLVFRADAGTATPGTLMFRRDLARYPNLARGEDSVFMLDVRRRGGLSVLGREQAHLFVRRFHGANTWDERHFLRRLHRRPADWPSWAWSMWWCRDPRRHRAFRLSPGELATARSLVTLHRDDAHG